MINDFKRNIHMGVFLLGAYKTKQFWRHPDAVPDVGVNLKYNVKLAKNAEKANLDFVFVADIPYTNSSCPPFLLNRFEPLTLLSALSSVTNSIGLVGTISSSYTEPYNVARQVLSLDHLSSGRAGCNIVTTVCNDAYKNFSMNDKPTRDERYDIANEYIDVINKLWLSWDKDSALYNKETCEYIDRMKLNPIDHRGDNFQVAGPLNIYRSIQNTPVIFHAGFSNESINLAVKHADVIFSWSDSFDNAVKFYKKTKSLLSSVERNEHDLLVLLAASVLIVDENDEVSKFKHEMYQLDDISDSIVYLSEYFNYDFSIHSFDDPFPECFREKIETCDPIRSKLLDSIFSNKLTIRQVANSSAASFIDFFGTPETVANKMQYWFENKAADGFIISEFKPGSLTKFMELVVPILKHRGIFKENYTGSTLREHLDLN